MSTHGPDSPHDPSEVEYLSEDETARPRGGSGRKRTAVVVGAAALVVLGGASAYGLMQFMSGGDSAATAVPDHALGYLSLDLDPSGGQKVAAYKTMRKFPALKEQLGLTDDDDPREWVVDAINDEAPTACQLDFEDEVKPWVGNKVAVSGVKTDEGPQPFFVLEVSDSDAAEKTVEKLFTCDGPAEEYGTAFVGDFMVVAPDGDLADDIAADAEESPLSDDDDFQDRLEEAGDQGIVTGYLAPAAADLMVDEAEQMEQGTAGSSSASGSSSSEAPPEPMPTSSTELPGEPGEMPSMPSMEASPGEMPESYELEGDMEPQMEPGMGMGGTMFPMLGSGEIDLLRDYFDDFEGAAMQVRFADEGLEMEMVASGIDQLEEIEAGDSGMSDLPSSTAIAYGLGFGDKAVDLMEDSIKGQMSDAEYDSGVREFEQETGLSFPEDVKTLLGDGLSLAVDGSIDFEQLGMFFMGGGQAGGADIPAGIRVVTDDPAAVVEVTDKLEALIPPGTPFQLEVEEGDDAVGIGLDADYVSELAGDGDLGDSDAFENAVPDADESLGGLYIDFDAENWLDELAGQEDPDAAANVKPLSSLGMVGTTDGDTGRMVLRLTTD